MRTRIYTDRSRLFDHVELLEGPPDAPHRECRIVAATTCARGRGREAAAELKRLHRHLPKGDSQ